jgi:UDP-N-acetylglucosamine 2-epimerase (non-hydrolysing)
MESINELANHTQKAIIYSCHPRSRKKIAEMGFTFHSKVQILEPFGFWDFIKLQTNAYCVISDSGTLPEESAILNFPSVSLRTSTERPEAIDSGVFIIGSITSNEILQSVELAVALSQNENNTLTVSAYSDTNVSSKVVKIIQSYTPLINKMIWRK